MDRREPNLKELYSESECPCRPDVSTDECEDCQDLPRGYFENRRREARLCPQYGKFKGILDSDLPCILCPVQTECEEKTKGEQ
jgi:hypothetical protein